MDSASDTGSVQETDNVSVETTATKPERNKRGTWVTFLRGLTTTETVLTYETREELFRVRSTIVTGANRLGIPVKTKSARGSTTLSVRLKTAAEVAAKVTVQA